MEALLEIQGHITAQGILHLQKPNFGPNSGKQIIESNSWLEFVDPVLPAKFTLKDSPSKIHLPKFNPEFGPKNSHCISAGPFG